MIVQDDLVNNQLYAILAHLIPDIIFRAPTPIVLIAFLTVRTLQICSRRTVGSQTIQHASRVPYLLTLLNAKFILCNTLYVFNTFLLEVLGYGGKTSAQQSELEMTQYIRSLYLTDFSNLGLAVHSATNWLIFYHWPRLRSRRQKKISNLTMTSNATSKATVLDVENVEELLQRFIPIKYTAATNILTSLCAHSNHLAKALIGSEMQNGHDNDAKNGFLEREDFAKNTIIQKHAIILGDTLENILRSLVSKSSITEWRDVCRSLGYRYHKINLHCSAEHWKMIRVILVQSIGHNSGSRWQNAKVHQSSMTNVQRTMAKVFNYSLREMKSGALCAMVDRAHKQVRLQRSAGDLNESKLFMHCDSLNDREAHERSLSPKRHNSDISRRRNSEVKRVLLRSCESLSLIIPRAESMDATSTVTDATTTVTDSRRSTDVIVETRLTSNGTLSNGKTITKPNWEMKSCITSENGHVLSDI
ncbi:hypothetical protein DdX_22465 [Ditylenchus destructor]|uniref:Uncharacterized protein n=1 Tax=Ditylenchus destructor TaxID=166010 RepID=A0AAD4QUR7_9BILA|nr:hypothetical protein DdX_22465 [Ditylenchus destructor]